MPLEAIYEKGILKLSQPITLAEGSKVQLIILPQESDSQPPKSLEVLQEIAKLPLEGNTDGSESNNHDQVLYQK